MSADLGGLGSGGKTRSGGRKRAGERGLAWQSRRPVARALGCEGGVTVGLARKSRRPELMVLEYASGMAPVCLMRGKSS